MSTSTGSYRLVTVNNAPERAKQLVGRVVNDLKDRYTIIHVANCDSPDRVREIVKEHKPDILVSAYYIFQVNKFTGPDTIQFCASMWTSKESEKVFAMARSVVPGIKTHAIPEGLQVQRGPNAVVEHLIEQIPVLLG